LVTVGGVEGPSAVALYAVGGVAPEAVGVRVAALQAGLAVEDEEAVLALVAGSTVAGVHRIAFPSI
jgi:hypothetical protein